MSSRARELTRILGVELRDADLVELAMRHRSWAFEHECADHNERLEFLGDAVLELAVTDLIYRRYPEWSEGQLAKVRAAAVKTPALAGMARDLGLGDFVLLGRGEAASGGAEKDSILADAFEALLGAVYLDRGFDVAFTLVTRLFTPRLAHLADLGAALDFKTSLQELAAAEHQEVPEYRVESDGPDHERTFTAEVRVGGRLVGTGEGPNKKSAEKAAAEVAYRVLSDDADGGRGG